MHVDSNEWVPGDIAIMYRTNAQSRSIEEVFLQRSLPYRIVGGTRFYARREVKDILAYLRLIHNQNDDIAFDRVVNTPGRSIGKKSRTTLQQLAEEHHLSLMSTAMTLNVPVTNRAKSSLKKFCSLIHNAKGISEENSVVDVIEFLLRETDYQNFLFKEYEDGEERWLNVMELKTVAGNYDAIEPPSALGSFLEDIALVADVDSMEEESRSATTLITLHASKGLEFPVVFLTGMEEGLLPHSRSFDDLDAMEEERRLCYVGITRAQSRLYLLHAFRRSLAGSNGHNPRSRYLDDIPETATDGRGRTISTPAPDLRPVRNRQVTWDEFDGIDPDPEDERFLLAAGDSVKHKVFGIGLIVACKEIGKDKELTIDFDGIGIKKVLLSLAPLQKI